MQEWPIKLERLRSPAISIVLVRDVRRTTGLVAAWEALAAQALEPNVSYEHRMLLPALRNAGAKADARVALLWRGAVSGRSTLAGLMPLCFITRRSRPRVSAARVWRHPQCHLTTPLLRADCATECVGALLEWLRLLGWADLLELPSLSGDGPVHRLLLECCARLNLRTWRTAPESLPANRLPTAAKAMHGLTIAVTARGELTLAARQLLRWTDRTLLRQNAHLVPAKVRA